MSDVFTIEHIHKAVEALQSANAPTHANGYYAFYVHPVQKEDLALVMTLETIGASYRLRLMALSIQQYELRRKRTGKRGHVTAQEVLQKAMKVS